MEQNYTSFSLRSCSHGTKQNIFANQLIAICGSDLHMYQGRTAAESGLVFGHENMGIVTEVGEGVTLLKKGDRIVLPFNVADGRCRNCEQGKTAFCTGKYIPYVSEACS